ncbi:hypothetical protein B0H14DRAFT_3170815 [Mycena olivaceomarginata]|nr:hypothetical protein B0H14DRAFT_3170815 [Mycena olivaceomarginata]
MDYKWTQELGLIRKPAAFISTISDERGQELLYTGMRISDVFKEDIASEVSSVCCGSSAPWATKFIEMVSCSPPTTTPPCLVRWTPSSRARRAAALPRRLRALLTAALAQRLRVRATLLQGATPGVQLPSALSNNDAVSNGSSNPNSTRTGFVINFSACTWAHRGEGDKRLCLVVPFGTFELCFYEAGFCSDLKLGDVLDGQLISADPVQDEPALLAVYPMASANPSTYVIRHPSSLSLAGALPSSLQPQYYVPYPPGNPPQYTEYPPEAQYLAADNSGSWESACGEASTMISQQVDLYVPSESTQDFFG